MSGNRPGGGAPPPRDTGPRAQRPVRDPARLLAAEVILAVEQDEAFANLLLPRRLRERGLTGTDAAFATELSYGTLRRQGVLDLVLSRGLHRDLPSLDAPVRAVLRLGAYQLLHTRVPPHAAVSATVEVSRDLAGPRTAGLVNAALRRVAEHDWPEWSRRLGAGEDEVGRLAIHHGYPRWIAVAFLEALAGDITELAAVLAEDRPTTHLLARPGRISRDDLLAQVGPGGSAGSWSPYAVRLASGDPGSLPAVRARHAVVQDEGSQLAALTLARATVTGGDARWLDTCAGPGGKSALLAGLLPEGALLLAADLHPHRALLLSGVLRGQPRAFAVAADATRPPWRPGEADRVLVDAPCSGLGALRRRPEVRWRRRPDDIDRLRPLQVDLLHAGVDAVRPGGVIGYVTCSPHVCETTEVVSEVRRARPDLEPLDVRALLPGVPLLGAGPHVQLWPHRQGTDAMFLAVFRRSEPSGLGGSGRGH